MESRRRRRTRPRCWLAHGTLSTFCRYADLNFHMHLHAVLDRLGRYDDILKDIRDLWGRYVADGLNSLPEYIRMQANGAAALDIPTGRRRRSIWSKSIAGLYPLKGGLERDGVRSAPVRSGDTAAGRTNPAWAWCGRICARREAAWKARSRRRAPFVFRVLNPASCGQVRIRVSP